MQKEVMIAIMIDVKAAIERRPCIKSVRRPSDRLPIIAPTSNIIVRIAA